MDLNLRDHPHLDYGYAVNSHSGQGTTADRVLVHVDTENAHEQLINSRLAYVAVSRGRYDAQIFTNDAGKLGDELSREVSKHSALGADHCITQTSEALKFARPRILLLLWASRIVQYCDVTLQYPRTNSPNVSLEGADLISCHEAGIINRSA